MSFTINKKRLLLETCQGLGEQLKRLREQRGWSLEEVCAQIGLDYPEVFNKWKKEKSNILFFICG